MTVAGILYSGQITHLCVNKLCHRWLMQEWLVTMSAPGHYLSKQCPRHWPLRGEFTGDR